MGEYLFNDLVELTKGTVAAIARAAPGSAACYRGGGVRKTRFHSTVKWPSLPSTV